MELEKLEEGAGERKEFRAFLQSQPDPGYLQVRAWSPLPRRLGAGRGWARKEGGEGWCPGTHRCVQSCPSCSSRGLCVLIWEAAEEEVTRPGVGWRRFRGGGVTDPGEGGAHRGGTELKGLTMQGSGGKQEACPATEHQSHGGVYHSVRINP